MEASIVNVAIVYNNHQPSTRRPGTTTLHLPYVRAHGLRAYHDMPIWAERFGIKVHFGLTPILIDQLEALTNGQLTDRHLQLSRIPAARLTFAEKLEILQQFFETAVDPEQAIAKTGNFHALFRKLQQLRNNRAWHKIPEGEINSIVGAFSIQEYRDIQALSNLAMFGYENRLNPRIAALMGKEHFSETDKREIISLQFEALGKVIQQYRRLQADGKIDVTTTPYGHPISPLLIDALHAWDETGERGLPVQHYHPDDARQHLHMAKVVYERTFGRPPKVMWPAEGTASNPFLAMVAQIMPSMRCVLMDKQLFPRSTFFPASRDWRLGYNPIAFRDTSLALVGRDHELSDLIGFYQGDEGPVIDDLLGKILAVGKDYQPAGASFEREPTVTLVLDGENMQRHRCDDAYPFYRQFYTRLKQLEEEKKVRMVLLSQQGPAADLKHKVTDLAPGSWIHGNFKTWMGNNHHLHPWVALARVSAMLDYQFAPEARIAARQQILAACGCGPLIPARRSLKNPLARATAYLLTAQTSCFMWWYGGERGRDADLSAFDRIFRSNLAMVYHSLGTPIPEDLETSFYLRREFDWVEGHEALFLPRGNC